jgi:hypothetical protein
MVKGFKKRKLKEHFELESGLQYATTLRRMAGRDRAL